MRRFSQRSALVTLSEINITPLLDLAFVLLIIFVITTPLLQQSINLKLPQGGAPDTSNLDKRDIRTIEIAPNGEYRLEKVAMHLDRIITELVRDAKANPKLVVAIRADENGRTKDFYAVIDACQTNGITRYSLKTEARRAQHP
jgi:biopolymer transport protein ExbD